MRVSPLTSQDVPAHTPDIMVELGRSAPGRLTQMKSNGPLAPARRVGTLDLK